jgi:hypothetical protein
MALATELYEKLRELPALLRRVETRVDDLDHLRQSLAGLVQHFQRLKQPDATYVYLLPPKSITLAQVVRVPVGSRERLTFAPCQPLEAGVWVVAVGPAVVRTVTIGNHCQSTIDFYGQVCQTKDEAPLGVLVGVELEGR